jgi:acetoin utilization deacetylase AcuC-like enzyme
MNQPVRIYFDKRMYDHVNGPGHPERPDRLKAIVRSLTESPVNRSLEWVTPRPATLDQVRRVHSVAHVDRIDMMRGKTARLDADTGVAPGSVDAAYLAAGAMIDAVEAMMAGEAKRCFALVRPPGHHAERHKVMGFCYFNSVAIGAEHAREALGCQRVLIVDWDVHHGNGTQHAFYGRRDVLSFSSHRYPFFPGSGWVDESGEGEGKGYTVNLPLPAGVGDELIEALYRRVLVPIAEAYRPDLVLVSAGFDAHLYDPLGGWRMSERGFASLCALVQDIADRFADGRLALVLEGGYDLGSLARSTRACLEVMAGGEAPHVNIVDKANVEPVVLRMRAAHARHWPVLVDPD